jgi:RHS repeat-associated protein
MKLLLKILFFIFTIAATVTEEGFASPATIITTRTLGRKQYELTDHLGNVRVLFGDRLTKQQGSLSPNILAINNYYPYGMLIKSLSQSSETYRWGFNGKEKDDKGEWGLTHYNYGFRIYNPALGRFLSIDPLTKSYPELTPYQFSSNRPIDGIDLDGLEYYSVHVKVQNGQEPAIKIVDYTKTKQGYGILGPGIEYRITSENGLEHQRFEENIYGVYQGGNNPKKYWEKPDINRNYPDWYGLSPVDETDANSMLHDLDYDKVNAAGLKSVVLDKRTVAADNAYINRANKTIEKYKAGENDDITGVPVTEQAKKAAAQGKTLFSIVSIKNIGNLIDELKDVPFKIEQSVKETTDPTRYYK